MAGGGRLMAMWLLTLGIVGAAGAAEWHVATGGKPDGEGSRAKPWDLESALSGRQKLAPGDTLWIQAGTYKHPNRKLGSPGYVVHLAGQQDRPIQLRGAAGRRVTIDGGLSVEAPSTWLWIRDLEILVSENSTMSRKLNEPGSSPQSYNRPWGGLNVHAGQGCKFINLVIHDNAQGVSWWVGSTQSELYGCTIYDNGWDAPDRGHGHAVYTQNKDGTKTIADCIMTGGHGYTMHAYGSGRAYVDNYVIEGNIAYNAGPFLVGGGRPSHNIRVLGNFLYKVDMQIGYSAQENEDCEVSGNVILDGGLSINKYKKVVKEDNLVLGKSDPRPKEPPVRIELRPNWYDPQRANLVVFNWAKQPAVEWQPAGFLKPGDKYRLMDSRDLFGKPVLAGSFDGKAIGLPMMTNEFAAWVLFKEPAK
jgi:hypothetical protein